MAKELGWPEERIYAFATEKLESAEPITSLTALRNDQVTLLRDRIRYGITRRDRAAAKTTNNRKRSTQPKLVVTSVVETPADPRTDIAFNVAVLVRNASKKSIRNH